MPNLASSAETWPSLTFGPVNLWRVVPAWRCDGALIPARASSKAAFARGTTAGIHPGVKALLGLR
jgi:hypothetical protein